MVRRLSTFLLSTIATVLPLRLCSQQEVRGVKLGVTNARELRTMRQDETTSGKTPDGWSYIAFGLDVPRYTYYFSQEDSIVEWARVFVTNGYTAARVREAFGRPDTTSFGEDLSKRETFTAKGVVVSYRSDNQVSFIEYHPHLLDRLPFRRYRRATKVRDSVLADVMSELHPEMTWPQVLDSVRIIVTAKARTDLQPGTSASALAAKTKRQAARFDSLCAQIDCEQIMAAHRAFDSKP
jgi:hypothetical protein